MAITSSSQVLNTSAVRKATDYLNESIGYLSTAKMYLNSALKYSNESVYYTNEGNPIPAAVKELVAIIDDRIAEIKELKSLVEARAEIIHDSESAEYQKYLDEQDAKANASTQVQNIPYTGQNNESYQNTPYDSSSSVTVTYI